MTINWSLWLGLLVVYFILDGIGTKNIVATNRLDRFPAANSSAFMYLFGVVGSFICVKEAYTPERGISWEGLINVIPIATGAWLGTFSTITFEIKKKKTIKQLNKMLKKIREFFKSKAVKDLEKRVAALEAINTQRAASRQARFNKTKKQVSA